MKKNKEVQKVIAYLKDKDDKISRIRTEVLFNRYSEKDVFDHYVSNVGNNKDEESYCTARDAAMYLSGKIELGEFLPECVLKEDEDESCEQEQITISKELLDSILSRLDRLEHRLKLQRSTNVTKRKSIKESSCEDLISQIDACKYVGCGKTTIKRWADNGFITGYIKGLNVYYSKKELDHSVVVKEHRQKQREKLSSRALIKKMAE